MTDTAHTHGHGHDGHAHTHGVVDPSIAATSRGLWAVKWSFVALMSTACLQIVVVLLTGSVGLLADTVHNLGDAATAIPLAIAFMLAKRPPTKRFPFGYGRAEDLAGMIVVLLILFSAVVAGYESVSRLLHPHPVNYIWAVAVASVIGFIGNEAVAVFRIRVGREIGSAALVADGYHARMDGLTSLAVLFGAIGVWMGFPLADPIVGLLITVSLARIVWQSTRAVFTRALDGVEPEAIDELTHAAAHVEGVRGVLGVRARWCGHSLRAEITIVVDPRMMVGEAHRIATEVQHEVLHHVRHIEAVKIHVDPQDVAGEELHVHDGLPAHSH